ncbi:glucosamine-6-phosphate deaminase [Caminicella sporogenes DSM 14501]|uniref:Glucosamine-6-phosphate deaminase n=1 Tax=Caminicella sporogenes DSM 14501 TaxID=1121266 RepID=A0A1M6NZV0_9FIRM|nr:glucosamine-6-phosphate deaminase [Caminicella sporogenes]RKD21582.1 glucosamine-6-phosphate deaminase [Caminicella sporogenes]WIF94135.1 glucosamine-6-phosphate deaminase [Caminicella sporogenes]SHK01245.1 glucosamine-6-phosphate deaminase [Caminicella sporogenes DSM 14501]
MKILIVKDYDEMSKKAANMVASQIILKPESVIGLATGDTPKGMYRQLVKLYKDGYVDFKNVKTFNLDEYYGLEKDNPQSYNYYMMENLFKHVNIKRENINIPNGMAEDLEIECEEYEKKIEELGGIDLQVLGIGRNGHIGFNEPDLKFEAKTHLVRLDEDTIKANSRFFNSIEEVPTMAISMGIKTIMNARKIILLASGKEKAEAIYKTVNGKITPKVPASVLQLHPDVTLIIDKEAASLL